MKSTVEIAGIEHQMDLNAACSIAISLIPNGPQPSHFGANACSSEVLVGEGFVGDTKQGGSCNVNQLTIIPHCNGTHTESIAHITDEMVPVYQTIKDTLFPVVLISITPKLAAETNDSYIPNFDETNLIIERAQLENQLKDYSNEMLTGLVVRTLPNETEKQSRTYDSDHYPVYFTNDAMEYLVEREISHLLVDFPSVDKMYDEGKLSNHRIFWNVALDSSQVNNHSTINKTITEMVFVDDEIKDGCFVCNLQIPQIHTDAVPSRPVLIPLTVINTEKRPMK